MDIAFTRDNKRTDKHLRACGNFESSGRGAIARSSRNRIFYSNLCIDLRSQLLLIVVHLGIVGGQQFLFPRAFDFIHVASYIADTIIYIISMGCCVRCQVFSKEILDLKPSLSFYRCSGLSRLLVSCDSAAKRR